MKLLINILGLAFSLIVSSVSAQDNELVTIRVISEGKTEDEALTEALRSALIQTSSVFISSNTVIINDEIEKDKISMISNGSIASYKILDKFAKSNNSIVLTSEVIVSINKLGSFVESVGGSTELKGGVFANNVKLIELNKLAEEQSIKDMLVICDELFSASFDYSIVNGEPVNYEGSWSVPLEVIIKKNKNYGVFTSFFYSTLRSLTMKESDIQTYIKLKLPFYSIGLFDNSDIKHSTPVLKFRHRNVERFDMRDFNKQFNLFKDYQFNYYTLEYKKDSPLTYRGGNTSEFMDFINKNAKIGRKKVGYVFPLDYIQMRPFIYTTTNSGVYDHIVLRSHESFKLIAIFIEQLSRSMQDIEIKNGISNVNISKIQYRNVLPKTPEFYLDGQGRYGINYQWQSGISRYEVYIKDYSIDEIGSNFEIAIKHGDGDETFEFISDYRNFRGKYFKMASPSFSIYGNSPMFLWNYINSSRKNPYLENSEWLTKIFLSIGQREDRFGLIFANYLNYQLDVQKLSPEGTFPLQLTMIGDENSIVYKIKINNYLTTEQISKVTKYTIERNRFDNNFYSEFLKPYFEFLEKIEGKKKY